MNTKPGILLGLSLIMALLAGQVRAEDPAVTFTAVHEPAAMAGSEWSLTLRLTIPKGYYAYQKDNPGTGLPVSVTFKELSGLVETGQVWPKHKVKTTDFGDEWILEGTFDITWKFQVPADARGTLVVSGEHQTWWCNDDGCLIAEGSFTAALEVTPPPRAAVLPAPGEGGPQLTVGAEFEGDVRAGGKAVLALHFEVSPGFAAYHKDNPGISQPIKVTFSDLGGLTLSSEAWPKPKQVKDEYGEEWKLEGAFTIRYTFDVPAKAADVVSINGKVAAQICDDEGCHDRNAEFATSAPVQPSDGATPAAEPEKEPAKAPETQPAQEPEAPAPDTEKRFHDAMDHHGFYLDFDYALDRARRLNKPLLVDFNGRNCRPCRQMEAEVFPLPEVKALMEGFVIASVQNDIGDTRYNELWVKYRPSAATPVPYYAILDHDGEVVRGIGSTLKDPSKFVAFLKGEATTQEPAAAPESPQPVAETAALSQPEPPAADTAWPEGVFPPPADHIRAGFAFEARFTSERLKPGGEVTLELRFKMKQNAEGEHYHLYHPGTKALDINIPLKVEMVVEGGLEAMGDWVYPDPKIQPDEGFGEEWFLPLEFTLTRKFRVPADAAEGAVQVGGNLSGQFCDTAGCTNFNMGNRNDPMRKVGWVASLTVAADGLESALAEIPKSSGTLTSDVDRAGGMFWWLLAAFAAGMVTLLTPCVLPVLPLTVGFFVSQAEKGRSAFTTALIYCFCIVATFTMFGLIVSLTMGAAGAQQLATNGWVNSFLAILFLTFALSFLGLFELRVPTFMTAWFSQKQMRAQQEGNGYAKAFFSGSAFSLISFSCTGPIAGAFLAGAASAETVGDIWLPTLTMLAFSAGLALPIFVMGQFPSLMKRMPKSGGWMNAMKVVFGFVELGLAIMYLSAAEQAFTGLVAAEYVNRYVVLAVWIAVSLASSLYLFGFYRMPHDHEETRQIGVLRSIFGVMFLSFALYLVPGLFGARLGPTLEGILPLPPENGGIQVSLGGGGTSRNAKDLPWFKDDLEGGLIAAQKADMPVFLDFTGLN